LRLSFASKGGKRVVWDLPILDSRDEDAIMDWASSNKNNAAAVAGFVQIVLLAARSAQR
jgi:hypothetical protein